MGEARPHRITWEAYKKLGGGRETLARSADEFYNRLILEEQLTMRRILLKMVKFGEGLEVTSRRVRRAALYQKSEANDRVDRVLERLIKARLVRVSEGDIAADEQVEVAHEALVRNWPRLIEWLEEERVALRQRQRLTTAADEWQRLGKEPSALWRGVLLEEVRGYEDLSKSEEEFLEASHEAEQTEIKKLNARATQLRRLALYLSVALVVALIAVIIATFSGTQALKNANLASQQAATAQAASTLVMAQQVTSQANAEAALANADQARRQATISRAVELALQSVVQQVRGRNFPLSLLLGVEAFHTFDTVQTRGTLLDNFQVNPQWQGYLSGHTAPVNSVAFSPDGKTLASCSNDGTVILWDIESRQPIAEPRIGVAAVYSVAFSPDGKTLAFGDTDGTIILWDVETGKPIGQPLRVSRERFSKQRHI